MAYPGPVEDEAQTTEADAPMNNDTADDAAMPANTDYPEIKLDKSNPDIADAFQNCKVGDVYEVTSTDDSQVTLKQSGSPEADAGAPPAGEDQGNDTAPEEPKGAVAILMAKKAKR